MTKIQKDQDTIAAVATAILPGQGGIAVIRISGINAKEATQKIVTIPGKQDWGSHRILYGFIKDLDKKELIDEVLILIMNEPRSFTGEDIVEIHCHGGVFSVQKILENLLKTSLVRRALPGEFSERAVLNGRMNLMQAEAVKDLIAARSQKAARIAVNGLSGEINKKIKNMRDILLDQLSEIEARVDFEEDLPLLNPQDLLLNIKNVQENLLKLVQDSKVISPIRNGLKIVLIGLPNVGKSSIINKLSKMERSIVTNIPGTTRDLLEVDIVLQGIPIRLIDTAGIHCTNDAVEKLGIEKSKSAIKNCDIAVLIFDISEGWSKGDDNLLRVLPSDLPKIILGNKADLKIIKSEKQADVIYSAKTGQGEEFFIKKILEICGSNNMENVEYAFNERQLHLAESANMSLEQIQVVASESLPWDFWTIDLRDAIHKLGEISGDEITESVLERIFSKFCIGK